MTQLQQSEESTPWDTTEARFETWAHALVTECHRRHRAAAKVAGRKRRAIERDLREARTQRDAAATAGDKAVIKTIGLIGRMSWQSTRTYYDLLNEMVAERLGGLHSAEIFMRSVDFSGLEVAMQRGDWAAIESRLGDEAAALEQGGADCVLLCSNTMHKLYGGIAARVGVPFFHIADTLGHALAADGLTRVGLLGTRFTMIEDFFANRLRDRFDIEVVVPDNRQI